MSVCYECYVLLVRSLYDELIRRLEESYRPWWVAVCDLEALIIKGLCPTDALRQNRTMYLIYRQLDKQRGNNKST